MEKASSMSKTGQKKTKTTSFYVSAKQTSEAADILCTSCGLN